MTIMLTQEEAGVEEELFFDEPIPCDRLDADDECDNSADYKTQASCCGHILMLCEDCLFTFITLARKWEGRRCKCSHCYHEFFLTPNHLIVTGRV
jgi:hypothetical protein